MNNSPAGVMLGLYGVLTLKAYGVGRHLEYEKYLVACEHRERR